MGALAAFTRTEGNFLSQTFLIGAVITFAVFGSVTIWAAFGAAIKGVLASPLARNTFNWFMASMLVLSLVPVLR